MGHHVLNFLICKKIMYFKFNQILKIMKKKDVDHILNMKLIKKIARGNTAFVKETQNKMYFFYGKEEKAYKTCYSGVKKGVSAGKLYF